MPPETVAWLEGDQPFSPRFGEACHPAHGAAAQSRQLFLGGCGLPQAWAAAAQWRILDIGFGFGLNFLTSWQAWRADTQRPQLLHVVGIEAFPVGREDLQRAARAYPALMPLANELADQWHGLLPGFHRLVFDGGRVMLTLCIGDVQAVLRAQRHFTADSIFLDGFSPEHNPQMWSTGTLKAVTRFARTGTRLASRFAAPAVQEALAALGFSLAPPSGLSAPPASPGGLRAQFAPAWKRRASPAVQAVLDEDAGPPARCAVVGAGLAGASVAASLARRGWQVTVLDASERPAAGASGAPAGLLAPHVSPDDALLSRLTRAGARATWQQARALLAEGRDWQASGTLERRAPGALRLPADWCADGFNESWTTRADQLREAGLPAGTPALWHGRAGWIRPARLVAAWLAQPGIHFEGGASIARITHDGGAYALRDAQGRVRARAERVVLAAGIGSRALAHLPLQPVRGQLAWGRHQDLPPLARDALPTLPLNGDGHLIPRLTDDAGRPCWLTGSTFEPGVDNIELRREDRTRNLERLAHLHPALATALSPVFGGEAVQDWAGVRCTSIDRRPVLGPLAPFSAGTPGLWICSALGSRGLSFAALCGELLAARWHGEPLPIPQAWSRGLDTLRLASPHAPDA